ncbi:hypothetical protein ACA910_015499 [Epithemia clementina (nom. ined.)]
MSMSSLQAQLAALHNSSTTGSGAHAGSSLPSSRRHEDAVGRGLHFRPEHGHAITDTIRFKATFIYETAEQAAKIPLRILHEQAQQACTVLADQHPDDASSLWKDLQLALSPTTDASKENLQSILMQLSTWLGELQDDIVEQCLHILEYLLRRYQLHSSSSSSALWEDLLWCLLPHHHTRASLVHRCLQLLDLATHPQTQSYLFLRPYADPQNPVPIPRSLLVQHVMKERNLLRRLLWMVREACAMVDESVAASNQNDTTTMRRKSVQNNKNDNNKTRNNSTSNIHDDHSMIRHGVAVCLSWTAACVVEGLAWQRTRYTLDAERQEILRLLLPTVRQCCMSTLDARWWGFLVASAAAETMDLGTPVLTQWTAVMLEYANDQEYNEEESKNKKRRKSKSNVTTTTTPSVVVQVDYDAWLALLSVLNPPQGTAAVQDATHLPLLQGKWLGCPLPQRTFDIAVHQKGTSIVVTALSQLYQNKLEMSPLVASFLVRAIDEIYNHPNDGDSDDNQKFKNENCQELVLALLHNKTLEPLWKHSILKLLASVSSFVATLAATQQQQQQGRRHNKNDTSTTTSLTKLEELLKEFYQYDPVEAEYGFVHALQQATSEQGKRALVSVLEKVALPPQVLKTTQENSTIDAASMTLPHVALNHANASVRLEAIDKLVSDCIASDADTPDNDHQQQTRTTKALLDMFLRRWSQEKDFKVAEHLGKSICKLLAKATSLTLSSSSTSELWFGRNHPQMILTGFYRWMNRIDENAKLLQNALEMMEFSMIDLMVCNANEKQLIVEACLAHVFWEHKKVSTAAIQLIGKSLGRRAHFSVDNIAEAIVESFSFTRRLLKGLQSKTKDGKATTLPAAEVAIRQRCALTLLMLLAKNSSLVAANQETAIFYLDLTCTLLESSSAISIGAFEESKIFDCLKLCAPPLLAKFDLIMPMVLRLASLPDEYQGFSDASIIEILLAKAATDTHATHPTPVSVLMEASLQRNLDPQSTCRLLNLAADYATVKAETPLASMYGVIPALHMLENDNDKIRFAAFSFLGRIGAKYGNSSLGWNTIISDFKGLKVIYGEIFSSLGVFSGQDNNKVLAESLQTIISKCAKTKVGQDGRLALLRLCNLTYRAIEASKSKIEGTGELSAKELPHTIETVSTVLKAMELSGEESFPLSERWQVVGQTTIETILKQTDSGVVRSFSTLLERTVRMLRGRYVTSVKVAFSSGPRGAGGRVRSYSLGSMDDVKTLESYPNDMINAIVAVLSSRTTGGLELISCVLQDLFLHSNWVTDVFAKLSLPSRVKMFETAVKLVAEDVSNVATATFLQLPFDAEDVHGALPNYLKVSPLDLPLLVCVTGFVSGNAEQMGKSVNGATLFEALFATLVALSSAAKKYEAGDLAFACHATVNCLRMLSENHTLLEKLPSNPSSTTRQGFRVLRALQVESGQDHETQQLPFSAHKSRLAALSLTAALAEKYHSEVGTLLDALKYAISSSALGTLGKKHRVDIYEKALSVFWRQSIDKHASFGAVLLELVRSFEGDCDPDLVDALARTANSPEASGSDLVMSPIGALAAISIAANIKNENAEDKSNTALQIIHCAPKEAIMPAIALIFQYIKNTAVTLQHDIGESDDIKQPFPSHTEVISIAVSGKTSARGDFDPDARLLRTLLHTMICFLKECLQMEKVQGRLRNGTAQDDRCCLFLWQGSLWLNVVSHLIDGSNDEKRTGGALSTTVSEIVDELQSSMPLALFMASISRLLDDDARSELLSQALAMVAERVASVQPGSAEASLFLGLMPELRKAIGQQEVWKETSTASSQSALLAVEQIGRTLHLGRKSSELQNGSAREFEKVLEQIAATLAAGSTILKIDRSKFWDIKAAHRDLICSLALTSSTLIKIVGLRALSYLPRIIRPLVGALSMANDEIGDGHQTTRTSEPRDMQLAVIRAIASVADSVPQFLAPFLQLLLVKRALLSKSLRSGKDHSLRQAVRSLDKSLSSSVPARLFIPVLGKTIETATDVDDVIVLVQMLQMAVDGVTPKDTGSLRSSVFTCITKAIEQSNAPISAEHPVVKNTSAALVSFALKLSEGQLRRVYSVLREWKNEVTPSPDASNVARRLAFWAMSAALSGQIKSLFLPCVSVVVDDLSLELRHAVSMLCPTKVSKAGRKKRKLDANEVPPYPDCPQILQQVLLFLERSLRADARDGGSWTRAEEGKRYNLFLDPLVRLLQSNLSYDVSSEESPSYKNIVQGTMGNDEGNVVSCLTALALAAGDEQLWKPLNHAVLESAGMEGRSEVRIGGLVCLLSLIKSLGEEYMVLLPECLPVLSELLEDSHEEVAGLAREVVSMAEELLGENLDEALR